MEDIDFKINITIVGLGLIGGSFGKAIRNLTSKKIYGIDKNIRTIEEALRLGIIDEGYTQSNEVTNKADLIILALYPEDTIGFVKKNASQFKPGVIITDVCGIKQKVIDEINKLLPEGAEFVGGHPMAGKESSGIEHASDKLFKDTNYIITPHAGNSEKSLHLIEQIAWLIGCKKVIRVNPYEHDKIISFTSQLPHVIAVSLMNSANMCDKTGSFVGGSFKDATRVADINSKLWSQLFMMNAEILIDEIEQFEITLANIKNIIKEKDLDSLELFFKRAETERKKLV